MRQIRLFWGEEHACSYLPGQSARFAYADAYASLDANTYNELAGLGFRRSGDWVYRPQCGACSACVPVRIPVSAFAPNRSQRRNWQRNQDLTVTGKPADFAEEHYRLFLRYLACRHEDGGMASSSPEDYLAFLASSWAETEFVEFRLGEALLAVAVVDRLPDGLSAVYTFFEPAQAARGLGCFAVLWQITEAQRLGLDWLYLGYWVGGCRKMNYKESYRPLQARLGGQWLLFEKREKIKR